MNIHTPVYNQNYTSFLFGQSSEESPYDYRLKEIYRDLCKLVDFKDSAVSSSTCAAC